MNTPVEGAKLIGALQQRGFTLDSTTAEGDYVFSGHLDPETRCSIQISPSSISIPRIVILAAPPGMERPIPHVESDGGFCYQNKESVVINVFDVPGQVASYLTLAQAVWARVRSGAEDHTLVEEFPAFWLYDKGYSQLCDVETVSRKLVAKTGGRGVKDRVCVIASSEALADAYLKSWGATSSEKSHAIGVCTDSELRPAGTTWPPQNVRQVIAWANAQAQPFGDKLHKELRLARKGGHDQVHVLLHSPQCRLGFKVRFTHAGQGSPYRSLMNLKVARWRAVDCGRRALLSRSAPGATLPLEGKNILMVGCGTIGGHLADLLLRQGAGTAGELVLCDKDILFPDNFARHRLAFPHVLQPKASALAAELCAHFPGVAVRPQINDVSELKSFPFDLIVDATGEEALSNTLARRFSGEAFIPILHTWVMGAGRSVHAFLRTTLAGGCLHCATQASQPLTASDMVTIEGCANTYLPFPASTSLRAACLASETLQQALSSSDSVHSVEELGIAKTAHCTPISKNPTCPACR